jgi:acyl-CoA thioester hydrolase/thioesterase-3
MPQPAANNPPFSIFETALAVRPDDIDMNRHVHNSRYLDYVLAARFDQMGRCYKMSMETFLGNGYSWFVRTAHIDHKRPLNLGDTMRVRTWVREIGRREVTVGFEILVEPEGRLSAEGYFVYLLVDRDTGKARTIPDDVRQAYSV